MWPIQLAFPLFIVCSLFLSLLTLCNLISHSVGPTDLLHSSPAPHFITFVVFLIYCLKCPSFSTIQSFTSFFLKFKSTLLVKSLLLVECCFYHDSLALNFPRTSCIICYRAVQTVEIFYTLQLSNSWNIPHFEVVSIYHNLYWGQVSGDSHYLGFSTFIPTPWHLLVPLILSITPFTPS
jgi:hypothetical protein